MNYFLGQCRMWFSRRVQFGYCYYASVSEIAANIFLLRKIVGYIC